jgi:flagellar P-ring protein precursor FlgI
LKNVAAVAVHAEMPAFAKPGQTLDITVSSIANAKSLRGGSLLLAPLRGVDGQVYALAQGNLIVGGFGAEGSDGSKVTVNVPSVGRIPSGALIERAVATRFGDNGRIIFNLHTADFTTAKHVAKSINQLLGPDVASAMDAVSISVQAPQNPAQRVDFLSLLENLEVEPGEVAAKVVINSRTGTIVVGQRVRIEPVAITHGSLTVTVNEDVQVSQPNELAAGRTVVVPKSDVAVTEDSSPMFKFSPGPTLDDIVRAVNEVGAAPGDLMAILEALRQAGALKAEIMVI